MPTIKTEPPVTKDLPAATDECTVWFRPSSISIVLKMMFTTVFDMHRPTKQALNSIVKGHMSGEYTFRLNQSAHCENECADTRMQTWCLH